MILSAAQKAAIRAIIKEELTRDYTISPEEAVEWIIKVSQDEKEAQRVAMRKL